MALFEPRVFPEIVGEMIARTSATTPLTDVNFGSIFTTMLEAAAQEDDEQYFSMLEIIRGYSLDTITGSDLDDRATEYNIIRSAAQTATTTVTLGDTAITKVDTGVYSGLPGAAAGATAINGDDASGFPTSGSIIVGRNTPNAETVAYSSITNNTNYVTFNLSGALANDHGTDESIIYSQGGNRLVVSGTVVLVPASDVSQQINYTLDNNATILDGESEVTEIAVTAQEAGTGANVPVGAISRFDSLPFATATVTNPSRVTNGRDIETDQELRDRIKDHVQSLSRGTGRAIITGVTGLISSNKRVVSASLIEPTLPAGVVKLFIDDGTGFIPAFTSVGSEEIVANATGGEQFVEVNNFPIVKAFVETQSEEPFNLSGTETLFVEVGGMAETITFDSTDFAVPGAATAQEVLTKINAVATLYEARISGARTKVRIFSRSNSDEEIQVTGGTANTELDFQTDLKFTTKIYLERNNEVSLLSKDGITASIESGSAAAYTLSAFDQNLAIVVDGKQIQYANLKVADFLTPTNISANEIVTSLNLQLSGAVADASSNDTRVSLSSNTERSSGSKIRIVENFTKVFKYNGAFTDITTNSRTSLTNSQIFTADGNIVYFGHEDVKFESIFVALNIAASASMGFTAEFWNGSAWATLGVYDGTTGFTVNGIIWFKAPSSWALTTVNSQSAYWIRITRVQPVLVTPPTESRLKVCSANEIFTFSETERVGTDRDYTINRFIGQIEVVSPLQAGDRLTIGSTDTRARITTLQAPFNLSGTETLNVKIDGVAQVVTFQVGDFFTPGAALASEVVTRLNLDLTGSTATLDGLGTKVILTSNKWDGGSIEVTGGTAESILGFTDGLVEAHDPHIPSVESLTEPFVFSPSNVVVVIMNGNAINNFSVPCFKAGTTTAGTSASQIVDSSLNLTFPDAEDLEEDFEVYVTSGAQSGNRKSINTYDPVTGTLVLDSSFGGSPGTGVTYQILPKDAESVVKLWNNTKITLLSTEAEITASSGGTKVQIASFVPGEGGSVQVAGGTGNVTAGFSTNEFVGVGGYQYFTELLQLVQWTVDGKQDDVNFEGIRAAGVQVECLEPVTKPIRVEVDVTTREGISLAGVANDVKSAISAYINTLSVGADVIVSEIIVAVKNVDGVFDVSVTTPSSNVAIADNELARSAEANIIVG